ncbi:MAG: type II toxin-antitoxin system YhaV family toxin [Colwellia sp.]|nr:type II toxin-antitoxin system YhaV family toxin [Colwellia sp.]
MVVNGWTLYTHPLFVEQYELLEKKVVALKAKGPVGYIKKNATKRLAAIHKLAYEVIPQDPTKSDYRQGKILGKNNKHWFRAKFFQQYRLFFRYDIQSKVIVYAWVNDDSSKRAYESKTDAYKIFARMLKSGNPPDSWEDLLKTVKKVKPANK